MTMSISESERCDIYTGLEHAVGERVANNIMELLPQQPADQLVTRADMHANTTLLRGEMAELRAELRGEMADLRAELKGEMAELRADMATGFATAKVETNRLIVAGMIANAIAVITALVA